LTTQRLSETGSVTIQTPTYGFTADAPAPYVIVEVKRGWFMVCPLPDATRWVSMSRDGRVWASHDKPWATQIDGTWLAQGHHDWTFPPWVKPRQVALILDPERWDWKGCLVAVSSFNMEVGRRVHVVSSKKPGRAF
jgi:hypothetical protein